MDIGVFPRLEGVVDVVYNPLKTKLVPQAQAMGVAAAGGLAMLIAQAKVACEWFTGKQLEDGGIEKIYTEMLEGMVNLVLVGMPGQGKTSLGKAARKGWAAGLWMWTRRW